MKNQGRNRKIFRRGGGQRLFSRLLSRRDFSLLPVEIFILVIPEKVSEVSQKWKEKKKSWAFSVLFLLTILIFNPFLLHFLHSPPFSFFPLPFSSFSSTFSIFSLPRFSRLVAKNFPVESLWAAHCLLPPTLVTPLCRALKIRVGRGWKMNKSDVQQQCTSNHGVDNENWVFSFWVYGNGGHKTFCYPLSVNESVNPINNI